MIIPADPESFVALGGGFGRDRTRVWYGASELVGVDAATFVALACDYGHDTAQLVYCDGTFAGDPRTFEVLGELDNIPFARDHERVYFHCNELEGADAPTFALFGAGLAIDRHGLWAGLDRCDGDRATLRLLDAEYACDRERAWYRGQPIDGANAAALRVLGHGFASDGECLYLDGHPLDQPPAGVTVLGREWYAVGERVHHVGAELEGADAATWTDLGDGFARDARRVYFDGGALDGADPATFVVDAHAGSCGWARDARRVWWREYQWHDHSDGESIEQLEDVDAATFSALDATVARAGDQMLRRGRPLIEANAATFRMLGGGWYADAGALWFGDTRVPVAGVESIRVRDAYAIAELEDVSTLRSLGAGYAADSQRVLFAGFTIPGPDPQTARSLGGGYLVDARGGWFFELATESRKMPDFVASGGALAGADPRTVRRDRGYALDQARVYWGCVRVDGADATTFRALDSRHGAHASAVYYQSQLIAGADPGAFRVLGGDYQAHAQTLADINGIHDAYATDGRELYLQGRPVHDRRARYLSDEQQQLLRALVVPDLGVFDRWWATDGRVVMCLRDGKVDTAIDAPTFEVLGHRYARDRTHIYGPRGRLRVTDRDRFRVLADGYASDGEQSWHDGHPIAGSHGLLHALGGGWARDDAGIYGAGTFADADRATFVVLSGAGADTDAEPTDDPALYWGPHVAAARDRDRIWWTPHEPGIPAADAVVIAHRYALTAAAVFHAGRAVDADLASFTEIGDGYARDAFRGFFQGRPTR